MATLSAIKINIPTNPSPLHLSNDECFLCECGKCVIRSVINCIAEIVEWIVQKILHHSFYAGYTTLSPELIEEREEYLRRTYGATSLPCLNAQNLPLKVRYIKSPIDSSSGNVLIICLNTTYEDHHPRHWAPFLNSGIDIVLWNPTESLPRIYEEDLYAILQLLHSRNMHQRIGIKSYCASTDPAISAAARMNFPINMIIDRGHGDVFSLTRSFTCLAGWTWIQQLLTKDYACFGIDKIQLLRGKMLFLSPDVDQVMDYGKRNLTRELTLNLSRENYHLKTIPGDHWSKWGITAFNEALVFLHSVGFISTIIPVTDREYPDPLEPSECSKVYLPFLMKAWC